MRKQRCARSRCYKYLTFPNIGSLKAHQWKRPTNLEPNPIEQSNFLD